MPTIVRPAALAAAALVLLCVARDAPAQELRRTMPEGASVYIISPRNGAEVRNPVRVRMGLSEGGIAPAGVAKQYTGHHHLFIDADLPEEMGRELPPTGRHVMHFGLGQTEAKITLPPGRHTLQLVLADENHVPHNPPLVSPKITIHVVTGAPRRKAPPTAPPVPPTPEALPYGGGTSY
ncbi:MAG: DUF4399 domain-containing protein [Acetobacteraceae bacterium]|nr:DUF4399 domain-containing protein [Acetobacteraceae bacterium]